MSFLSLIVWAFAFVFVWADVAPDPSGTGPYSPFASDYRYSPSVDPSVLPDRYTELYGRLIRPLSLPPSSLPVLVFLHGNHGTCGRYVADVKGNNGTSLDLNCDYTVSGTCPPGYHEVQSYAGYDYLGNNMATWGYVVVSINANRGITCGRGIPMDPDLNLARGRLILRHLQLLSDWNSGALPTPPGIGVSLKGKLDLSCVGLMGHSRAGEAVRSVYHQYSLPSSLWPSRIPSLRIQGIFELAGSDEQSREIYDAQGLNWIGVIAGCDGDDIQLFDVHPFDRMSQYLWEEPGLFKGYFVIGGANHDYLNTEWKLTDSFGCLGPQNHIWKWTDAASTAMRSVAMNAMSAFYRSTVGRQVTPSLSRLFNPLFDLPQSVANVTDVQRSFLSSVNVNDLFEVEDFSSPTGFSKQGLPEQLSQGVTDDHSRVFNAQGSFRHDESLTANLITWSQGGWYQDTWVNLSTSAGLNVSNFSALSFRVCMADSVLNADNGVLDFSYVLLGSGGVQLGTPVRLSSLVRVTGVVGPLSAEVPVVSVKSGKNPTLQTVVTLLSWFGESVSSSYVSGIRFTFNEGSVGSMWVASIRFTNERDVPVTPPSFASF